MYNRNMPLVWLSLAFGAGIVAASLIALSVTVWLGMGLAVSFILILLLLLGRQPRLADNGFFKLVAHGGALGLAAVVFFSLGAGWYQYRQPDLNDPFHIAFYNDRAYDVLVTGTLAEPPDYRDKYTNLRLAVEAVDSGSGDLPAQGLVLVRVLPNETYEYGERVRVRGELKTPPENEEFSYRDYLARSGVYATMSKAEVTRLPGNAGNPFLAGMYQLKAKLLRNIYIIYPDPEASLLAGILLGVDTGLTSDLQQAFKDTGTAHIIAISGFNIAIIAGIFFSFFKFIFGIFFKGVTGERLGAFFAVLAIALYTLLVGAEAAVVRAALMGGISLLARQLGRRNAGLNALAVVALMMTAANPFTLWDVGFQLSFLATLGLILYAEPFSNFTAGLLAQFSRHDLSGFTRFLNDNVILTFAAQLMTIPIMAYHFQRISLISFIANPFILPAQPAVMILGGLAALASLILLPLGQLLAWIAVPFSIYTVRAVEFFGSLPNGVYILKDSSIWAVLATYLALFAVTFSWDALGEWIKSRSASLRAAIVTAIFGLLFICSLLLWRGIATAGDGQLHLTFLEVGSANAVLIQTPAGRNVLINGGPSTAELSDELGRRLPFFSKKLDWLVIAATADDELAALPRVVERYPPEQVLQSGNFQASFSAQTLEKYFAKHEIPVTRAEVGQRLELGEEGLFIEVLAVGSRGSVLLVQYKDFRALLPIGVDADTYGLIHDPQEEKPAEENPVPACECGEAEQDKLQLQVDAFLAVIKDVDVFLLADSGYAPANPPAVLHYLHPQLFILSVEAGDPDGLPHQDLLDALAGYSLLRTDLNGWISIITDGSELRVEVERGNYDPTLTP